ncbi:PAS domain-containing hybrid sensor histidine kinase/response regulator [Pseudomonas oryzae]|uniref:histidine kinase n=1 Tax=Pseudomonas oryzae TaxID=1392877 RepID=A0A1H1R5Q8_9PSED|nr:PAS domain-containing hybrid sensor histidine kinase/response regulator [Pseudomonas oryzae]SDS31068.1 PAS domain S-box-containing protein [Pseudomonas oryzae]
MRINTSSKLITLAITTLALASLGSTLLHASLTWEREQASSLLSETLDTTQRLARGSDFLTDAVRAYAATGDEAFRRQFDSELETFREREQAVAHLRTLSVSREELELVDRAKRASDDLLTIEYQAFTRMAKGEREQALAMVYSNEYGQAKQTIASLIDQARQLTQARLQERITRLDTLGKLVDIGTVTLLTLNLLGVLAALQLFYRRRLIRPITSMTGKIQRMLAGEGERLRFDEGAPGSEIADLALALEESRKADLVIREQATQLARRTEELCAAKEHIRQREAWYRSIIESAPDGILIADHDQVIRLANPRTEQLFGYDCGELTGQPLLALAPPDSRAAYAELSDQALSMKAGHLSLQLNGARKDGSKFPIEATLARLPDQGDEASSLCVIIRDVSERRREEAAMREARAQAEQAERAKSDFLANMSHEIRTPLNTILGMSHLAAKASQDSLQAEQLRQIQSAGDRLLALVDDILDLSRIERGELKLQLASFSPHDLLDRIARRFTPMAKAKGLRLTCTLAGDLPPGLLGDTQRIEQILAQYVDNAIKFTATGEIEISLRGKPCADGRIELNAFVRDTGIGLGEDQQQAVFDTFYQADSSTTRQYGGTGLGLAIARQLAALMDGSVGVESQPGQGSTFWLSVPLAIARHELPQILPNLQLAGYRVLLVEDHEVNQRLVRKLLEHVGIRATVAGNGRIAVDMVREEEFDLVLMDMQMPVLDGIGATREIRALGPRGSMPIVAISASAMPEDRQRSHEAGMDAFLAKPIKVEELYATLRRLLQPQTTITANLPAPEPTPAAMELPHIEGLDTHEGLRRVMGDRHLYQELLRGLVERERDTPEKIRQALAAGDNATAQLLAHTLKGLAGSIGAAAVMADASELEQALRDDAESAAIAQALSRLERRLTPLLAKLANYLGTPCARSVSEIDAGQLSRICAKLTRLLEEDDAEAATWFNQNAAQLRHAFPDGYHRLESAIRTFEFDKALPALKQLLMTQPLNTDRSPTV